MAVQDDGLRTADSSLVRACQIQFHFPRSVFTVTLATIWIHLRRTSTLTDDNDGGNGGGFGDDDDGGCGGGSGGNKWWSQRMGGGGGGGDTWCMNLSPCTMYPTCSVGANDLLPTFDFMYGRTHSRRGKVKKKKMHFQDFSTQNSKISGGACPRNPANEHLNVRAPWS